LTLPNGSREPLHDHDWVIIASLSREELDEMGVVMDFHVLRTKLKQITAEFEGMALNEVKCFNQNKPSAENVAKHVYGLLCGRLPEGVKLRSIKVVEEPGCVAEFTK